MTILDHHHLVPLLTVNDVAGLLKVRPGTIREWESRGVLPSVRIGRTVRFSPATLRNFGITVPTTPTKEKP